MPHPRSVAAQYAGLPLNVYFLHDVSKTVENGSAALWIHGHTHMTCDYTVGTTRVVCNPFGYPQFFPGEPNPQFRTDFDVVV
jgi:predicted phosphodiesterase